MVYDARFISGGQISFGVMIPLGAILPAHNVLSCQWVQSGTYAGDVGSGLSLGMGDPGVGWKSHECYASCKENVSAVGEGAHA